MSSLSKALKTITDIKFSQLETNDQRFAKYKQSILDSIEGTAPHRKLKLLLEAVSNPEAPRWDPTSTLMDSKKFDRYQQVTLFSDDSALISDEEKERWCDDLIQSLNSESERYKYAKLFSKLINESDEPSEDETATDAPTARAEMLEQRAEFDRIVFSEDSCDEAAITAHLEELFKDSAKGLEKLRSSITSFCNQFIPDLDNDSTPITSSDISNAIDNLIATGLMDNENSKVLREFKSSPAILSEIADVLSAKLANIGSWKWPDEGMMATMRRQLNGKYRIYVHTDLIDSIFLHHIGTSWAVHMRSAFVKFSNSSGWKRGIPTRIDKNFRQFYFGHMNSDDYSSIDQYRRNQQYSKYFMVQLAKSTAGGQPCYDDEGSRNGDSGNSPVNVAKLKQGLLHLLITELELSKALGRNHTIVRSDFAWFGPSLSHTAILTALKFMGVTDHWISFFKTFLHLPMKFEMDGPDAKLRVRSKGTPMTYALSDVFGESILFLLDFTVNRYAKGLFLYRAHDDFWLWHNSQDLCVDAWSAIAKFNKVMGLAINEEKSGSITIGSELHSSLPKGDIKWGFLTLSDEGKFVIDQPGVDAHIEEMKRQLKNPKAIFSWVASYNSYVARFLPNNFGEPTACFGYEHVDDIIKTLERVHMELFKEYDGSVLKFLSQEIEKRYGVTDLATGWFYLPITWGGLDLKNPAFPFRAMKTAKQLQDQRNRRNGIKEPLPFFGECLEQDRTTYKDLQETWADGSYTPLQKFNTNKQFSSEPDAFPNFERFIEERETWFSWWLKEYKVLLDGDSFEKADLPAASNVPAWDLLDLLNSISNPAARTHISMVYALHGEEMMKKWGSLKPVWDQSLPLGMIELWSKKKPVWAL